MLFTSAEFIGFLIITVLLYYLAPPKAQWILLLTASFFFCFFARNGSFGFILMTTLSSYLAARLIDCDLSRENVFLNEHKEILSKSERKNYKSKQKKKRLRFLLLGIILNFGALALLKYGDFLFKTNSPIHIFGGIENEKSLLVMPLGISFYTFQTMGYLIDVYRGKAKCEKNIFRLALFVSFFPYLLQGPITRYSSLSLQLYQPHKAKWENISSGALRASFGYFKKLVIADRAMAAVKTLVDDPEKFTGAYVLFLIVIYSLVIYADFTGGIDIAIGISKIFGISLAENFNFPFSSKSVREFWNRWHITLGEWFGDYVFLPLSICKPMQNTSRSARKVFGNVVGKRLPVYIATLTTWLLTGLWHGAEPNFLVWGLLNGAVILVSQELQPLYAKLYNKFRFLAVSRGWNNCLKLQTFFIIGSIRLLDCYRNVGLTFNMLGSVFYDLRSWKSIFCGDVFALGIDLTDYAIIVVGIFIILALGACQRKKEREIFSFIAEKPILYSACLVCFVLLILIFGVYGIGYDSSQFIYSQF